MTADYNCLLIDFDDSFTLNIAAELELTKLYRVKVLHWLHLARLSESDFLELLPLPQLDHALVVFGPGPGHSSEYLSGLHYWLNHLRSLQIQFPQLYQLGICMGHQLIWHNLGFKAKRSCYPSHGGRHIIELTEFWKDKLQLPTSFLEVQRYNSLVVDIQASEVSAMKSNGGLKEMEDLQVLFHQGELMMSCWHRVMTYQFHPESVGTSFRKNFFCFINHLSL